jgi:hypothetical protein
MGYDPETEPAEPNASFAGAASAEPRHSNAAVKIIKQRVTNFLFISLAFRVFAAVTDI